MKLIVGLGNPGEKYEPTRHNIGFMVIDKLAKEVSTVSVTWSLDEKSKSYTAKVGEVLLAKPQTYMNKSGEAVGRLVSYYRISPADVWIIHDDIDLPLGKIRIRMNGASGGHNGVDSIISALKTDTFVRFRLGIGRGKESTGLNADKTLHHRSVINFVLSRFRQNEAGSMKHLVKNGVEAVRIALTEGIDKAMNRFN